MNTWMGKPRVEWLIITREVDDYQLGMHRKFSRANAHNATSTAVDQAMIFGLLRRGLGTIFAEKFCTHCNSLIQKWFNVVPGGGVEPP